MGSAGRTGKLSPSCPPPHLAPGATGTSPGERLCECRKPASLKPSPRGATGLLLAMSMGAKNEEWLPVCTGPAPGPVHLTLPFAMLPHPPPWIPHLAPKKAWHFLCYAGAHSAQGVQGVLPVIILHRCTSHCCPRLLPQAAHFRASQQSEVLKSKVQQRKSHQLVLIFGQLQEKAELDCWLHNKILSGIFTVALGLHPKIRVSYMPVEGHIKTADYQPNRPCHPPSTQQASCVRR